MRPRPRPQQALTRSKTYATKNRCSCAVRWRNVRRTFWRDERRKTGARANPDTWRASTIAGPRVGRPGERTRRAGKIEFWFGDGSGATASGFWPDALYGWAGQLSGEYGLYQLPLQSGLCDGRQSL